MTVSCPDCRSVFRVDPAKVPATGVRARCSVCGGIIAVAGGSAPLRTPSRTPVPAASYPGLTRRADTPRVVGPMTTPRTPPPARRTPAFSAPQGAVVPRNATPTAVPGVGRATPSAAPLRPLSAPRPMTPTAASAAVTSPSAAVTSPSATAAVPAAATATPPAAAIPTAEATPLSSGPAPAAATPSAGTVTPRRSINPFLNADPGQRARRLARALVSDLVAYHPKKRDEGLAQGTLRQLFREDIKKSYEEYVEQVGRELAETAPHFQEALNDILAGGQRLF